MRHWNTGTLALLAAALVGGSASAMIASAPALAQETVKLELWSRQDPSGPLRPGNVVKAAERLNKALEAEGSDKRVEVVVRESPAEGFDDDALQLLKVFGIGEGPDMFIAAHEWICAFQSEGFALKLDDYIAKYPQHFGTIFPSLWESAKCPDGTYAIPQDAEARMFFYNKKLLRQAGYDDAFIEAMPERTLTGDLTMDELIDIAKQVVDKTDAQVRHPASAEQGPGLHHGVPGLWQQLRRSGERQPAPRARQARRGVRLVRARREGGRHPGQQHRDGIRCAAQGVLHGQCGVLDVRHLGPRHLRVPDLRAAEATRPPSSPTGDGSPHPRREKGGSAGSLTHPVVYAVAANAADPELAVRLLGYASAADLNTDHAVTTTHLGIKPEQLEDPRYAEAWPLARATELLKITKFLPNNPQFGDLNGIIYTAIQGVETGRLTGEEAADFVIDEAIVVAQGRDRQIGSVAAAGQRGRRPTATGGPRCLTRTGRVDGRRRQRMN